MAMKKPKISKMKEASVASVVKTPTEIALQATLHAAAEQAALQAEVGLKPSYSGFVKYYIVRLFDRQFRYLTKKFNLTATISGYDEKTKLVFILTFGEPESGDSIDNFVTSDGAYRIFVSPKRYPWYLDLLRNEGLIAFDIDEKNLADWTLRTMLESPGEGEIN